MLLVYAGVVNTPLPFLCPLLRRPLAERAAVVDFMKRFLKALEDSP
jgi:hypothetical protein